MSEIGSQTPNALMILKEQSVANQERLNKVIGYVAIEGGESPEALRAASFAALGYEKVEYTHSPLHETFHKENDPKLDVLKDREIHDWYRVVTDGDGKNWLLKTVNKHPDREDWLTEAAISQTELYAYRLANHVGYPVPETRAVYFDDKAWVAFSYIEDHIDVHRPNGNKHKRKKQTEKPVSNPEAQLARNIFNALCDTGLDESTQGIIDPATGTYFAQDINLGMRPAEFDLDANGVKANILQQFSEGRFSPYGEIPALDGQAMQYARKMLEKAQALTSEEAASMFSHGVDNYSDPEVCAEVIRNRAQALLALMDEGFFSAPTLSVQRTIS